MYINPCSVYDWALKCTSKNTYSVTNNVLNQEEYSYDQKKCTTLVAKRL